MAEKKRAYCKNTVQGRQRGRKYPPKFRAEVVMAMLTTNSICAVARRYGVPESTIRTWVAEEAKRGDVWAEERRAAAREIALRAGLGTRAQVSYLQNRVEENRRAAQVSQKLHARLDEAARARDFSIGTLLKSEDEALADAAEVGLVAYKVDPAILDNYTGQTPITWKDQLSGLATASGLMGSGDQAGAYSYLDILGMPQDSIDSYDTVANRAFEEYMNKQLLSKSLSASGKNGGSGRSSGSSHSKSGSSKSGSSWTNSQVLTALGKYQALSDDDPTKAIYAGILEEAGMLPQGTGSKSVYTAPSAGALTNLNMESKWTLPSTTNTTKKSSGDDLATMLAKNYAKKGYSAWAIMNNMHQNGYSDAEIARALENAGVN